MAKQREIRKPPPDPASGQDSPESSRNIPDGEPSGLNLTNHFLIAMPTMPDPVFGGSVVYLCEHNADGALGIIINRPTDMTMEMLFERVDLTLQNAVRQIPFNENPIMFGGPVQIERGFVLHSPSEQFSSMMNVSEDVILTTSKDVLEALAAGYGPSRFLVTLGCAGWSAGQLEQEISGNGWLTVKAEPHIIFDMPVQERFTAAMSLLGIDPSMLASDAGHA
jgi:putative transcriptional regulator